MSRDAELRSRGGSRRVGGRRRSSSEDDDLAEMARSVGIAARVSASPNARPWAGWTSSGSVPQEQPPPIGPSSPRAPRVRPVARGRQVVAPRGLPTPRRREPPQPPRRRPPTHDQDARLAHGDRAVAELERLLGVGRDLAGLGDLETPLRGDPDCWPPTQHDDAAQSVAPSRRPTSGGSRCLAHGSGRRARSAASRSTSGDDRDDARRQGEHAPNERVITIAASSPAGATSVMRDPASGLSARHVTASVGRPTSRICSAT